MLLKIYKELDWMMDFRNVLIVSMYQNSPKLINFQKIKKKLFFIKNSIQLVNISEKKINYFYNNQNMSLMNLLKKAGNNSMKLDM